ncbi:MAG: sulfur oxidation c-type cytochrome SoxA [Marivita sp.]|uniref:sulfur oxidation c-type cytochrome SoxA n=1 Tax=Marivita sp. TaxID=2003365 RepID=UPI0025BF1411|nr:sulfur oxidation c-type cytochrome SoxA [Marivita sp.]MCI5112570.1 sulfur oxidation c-type cytochrome SoxA [Marivita sp.]
MKYKAMTAFAALVISAPMVFAGGADDDTLSIDGEVMISKTAAPAHMAETGIDTIMSGWHFREDDTQAMQMDTFDNPGMIAVDQAMDAWNTVEGTAEKSCASCHEGPESLAGVRAVYPKWNAEAGEMRTLAMQVNNCRTEQMGAEAYKYDGAQMTAMEALISVQSRGMPVNVAIDGPAAEYYEKGKEIYYTRYGQLELSCANCHEQNYGNYIRADHLSQGQINGFPTYRLKNAGLVQTHNRFRGCIRDTRAETFAVGSPEFIALEVYVASRGNGLSVEGPSVRQ